MFGSVVFFLLGCVDFENEYSKDRDGDGFSAYNGDCDDENELINPDAEEICDEQDNDGLGA